MMAKQMATYQNNAVNTASGPQLTLMLYNGCIKFINYGLNAIETNDMEVKNTNIQKAQDIIQELMLTLDQNVELSKQLLPLYEFIYFQLQQGNIKNDAQMIREALTFVTDFRDTWKEVMRVESSGYVQGAKV